MLLAFLLDKRFGQKLFRNLQLTEKALKDVVTAVRGSQYEILAAKHVFKQGKILSTELPPLPSADNDWVICRVFHKIIGGKKIHISGLMRGNFDENEVDLFFLPPLTDYGAETTADVPRSLESLISITMDELYDELESFLENLKPPFYFL
ncbi:hypothetical protein FXO37_33913 [Capsicum annuum]|nr:hypothetical protein FXO37_33913 [Capsicum annuum]